LKQTKPRFQSCRAGALGGSAEGDLSQCRLAPQAGYFLKMQLLQASIFMPGQMVIAVRLFTATIATVFPGLK
jgi:hypothetical protein